MVLKHKETGQIIQVKSWLLRMTTIRRRVFSWANALNGYLEKCGRTHRLVMVTLTYHYGEDWKPNAINEFVRTLKKEIQYKKPGERRLTSPLLGYVWVAEAQLRGVIHYHVLLLVERGTKIQKPDEAGWWKYGSTRIETARSPYYVCAYVGKEHQKKGQIPKGARVCGAYIKKGVVDDAAMAEYKADCAPKWLQKMRAYLIDEGMMKKESIVKRVGSKWRLETEFGPLISESAYELVNWKDDDSEEPEERNDNGVHVRAKDRYQGKTRPVQIPVEVRDAIRKWRNSFSGGTCDADLCQWRP